MSDPSTRTYEWSPSQPERFLGLSGLEAMRSALEGELPAPPICATLDFRLVRVEPGEVTFEGIPAAWAYNPLGSVHGGYYATLLDSAIGCAVHTVLPVGRGYTSIDLQVRFVRALTAKTGPVRAEGKVLNAGSRIVTAEGRLVDAAGKLYGTATSSCLVLEVKP